ncbi:Hypothetical protein NTJ_02544 [Nesidiocoris tenuis]|uniref:Uncharacterized protein n=1 Tax=Nesidiocoris tenuis TaxID=355587 RepID=A0ABN7AHB7_9HEMI|nr:Hypothetical protein NTJ_02544 [Nesidiocoris tenuis]
MFGVRDNNTMRPAAAFQAPTAVHQIRNNRPWKLQQGHPPRNRGFQPIPLSEAFIQFVCKICPGGLTPFPLLPQLLFTERKKRTDHTGIFPPGKTSESLNAQALLCSPFPARTYILGDFCSLRSYVQRSLKKGKPPPGRIRN